MSYVTISANPDSLMDEFDSNLSERVDEAMRSNAVFFEVLGDRSIRPQKTKTYREAQPA